MHRIALKSLFQLPAKAIGALVGVATAGVLMLIQTGLYVGFLSTSSAVITNSGGDVWVMARGTEVFDNGEALSAGSRAHVAGHPCVLRVRPAIVDYTQVRILKGELVTTQVLGIEAAPGQHIPWSMARGLPADLEAPSRVAIELLDLEVLGFGQPTKKEPMRNALGGVLNAGGDEVHVAAITRGIRPFTLTPYIFARPSLARRLVLQAPGQATYWISDLKDPGCTAGFIAHVESHPDLEAHSKAEFVAMTQDFWINNSGIGAVLMFGALLALLVGMIIIGQTLSAITRSHWRELGVLKALGASDSELVAFVAWQAAFLAFFGGVMSVLVAWGMRIALLDFGLQVVLSPSVLSIGAVAIVGMCALASSGSIRAVLKLDANEVLQ